MASAPMPRARDLRRSLRFPSTYRNASVVVVSLSSACSSIPSSAQPAASRSRSLGPARVRRATRSPSRAAAAAAYTAVPPMRHSGSLSNSSRAACPIATRSNIKKDVHDLAVLDRMGFPFYPHDPLPLRIGVAPRFQKLVPSDHLRTDEPAFEIRVDRARRLLRGRAAGHGPCANFVLAGGEEGAEAEQLVGRADQPVQRGLREPELRAEGRRLSRGKLCDLRLELRADRDNASGTVDRGRGANRREDLLRRRDVGLIEVDGKQERHER